MPVRRHVLLVFLLTSPAVLGCIASPRMLGKPTKERPIVLCLVHDQYGLMFGGEDGAQRVVLPRTDDIRSMGISPSRRLAATLTVKTVKRLATEGQVTFYGPSKEVIATVDLTKTKPLPGASEWIWVGDRGEAVISTRMASGGYQPRPLGQPRKDVTWGECLYVNTAGAVQRFGLSSPVRQVYFTDRPGFAVLQWANAGYSRGSHSWLLSRFKSPSELAWEVMIITRDWVCFSGSIPESVLRVSAIDSPPSAGPEPPQAPEFDVSVRLEGGYLHFRPDASSVFERYIPNRWIPPDFRERTGAFYEAAFLIRAVDQLAQAAGLTDLERTLAIAVLRDFIYDCLDTYVRGGGEISPEDHRACVARADGAMASRLSDGKFQKYIAWRSSATGSTNALGFLFRPPLDIKPEDSFWVTVITPPAK